jgi:hypothetical protein
MAALKVILLAALIIQHKIRKLAAQKLILKMILYKFYRRIRKFYRNKNNLIAVEDRSITEKTIILRK